MQNIDRVLRGVFIVLHQGLCFQTCAIERQRPGLPNATYIGQRLFNDNTADALGIKNLKHQVQVTVADLLRFNQFGRRVQTTKLLCIRHSIPGGEGTVLRHCQFLMFLC